jgi:hypothetical protein
VFLCFSYTQAAPCSITDPGAARNKRVSVSWGSTRWWLDAPLVGTKSRYLNEKTTPKKGPSDGKKGLAYAICARKGARPYGCCQEVHRSTQARKGRCPC